MSNKIAPLEKSIQELSNKYHIVSYDLYKGIKLAFMSLTGNKHTDTHEPLRHILSITAIREELGGKCLMEIAFT